MQAENDLSRIKLRRYETRLTVSGSAVIAFAVWSIIRAALFFLTQRFDLIKSFGVEEELKAMSEGAPAGVDPHFVLNGILLGFLFFYMLIIVLIWLYIGRSAVLEGRGLKKKSILYLVLAVIMILILAGSLIPDSVLGLEGDVTNVSDPINTALTTRLLDLTSILALLEMVISAIQVRKIRKELGIKITGKRQTNLAEELAGIVEETRLGG